MLMPVIAAAVAQATSAFSQWPGSVPTRAQPPPRSRPSDYNGDGFRQNKRQRNNRRDGVRQYVNTCDGDDHQWTDDRDDGQYSNEYSDAQYNASGVSYNELQDEPEHQHDGFGARSQ